MRNFEHKTTTYHYKVQILSAANGLVKTVHEGDFSLSHGHTHHINQPVAIDRSAGQVVVKITLDYKGITLGHTAAQPQTQSIQYWLDAGALAWLRSRT